MINRPLTELLKREFNQNIPDIEIVPSGERSAYVVNNGKSVIKVTVDDMTHWREAIAHEVGHWACNHMEPDCIENMFGQELEAWRWALDWSVAKKIEFDLHFIRNAIFSHALEFGNDAESAVAAMIIGDALVMKYETKN